MKKEKHTSELTADFKSKLINRKSDLYEKVHNLNENIEWDKVIIGFCIDEISTIDKILKSIKKL
jgi:hypothetical protein